MSDAATKSNGVKYAWDHTEAPPRVVNPPSVYEAQIQILQNQMWIIQNLATLSTHLGKRSPSDKSAQMMLKKTGQLLYGPDYKFNRKLE